MKIFAVSDQHGMLDQVVPECDLLIVAGDNCPDRFGPFNAVNEPHMQLQWFTEHWLAWRAKQPAKMCFFTWGNHDFCGRFLHLERELNNATTQLVVDNLVEYQGLKIWLSPWCNQFMDWAWMMSEAQLAAHLKSVPDHLDIFVTHGPPKGYGDAGPDWQTGKPGHFGSVAIYDTIQRVRPKVVICGHIHEGYGKFRMPVQDDGDMGGVDVYNVAQAGGRATLGSLFLPESRGPVEIVLERAPV